MNQATSVAASAGVRERADGVRLRMPGQLFILSLGFALLLAISVMSVILIRQAQEDARAVTRSLKVMNAIFQVQVSLRRAESAQRGFLITENPDYLNNFASSRDAVAPAFDDLLNLLSGDPERRDQAGRLRPLAVEKFAEMEKTITLTRAGQIAEAVALVRSNRGEDIQNEIVAGLVSIRSGEEAALETYLASSRESGFWLTVVNAMGLPAVVALAILSITLARRNMASLGAAQKALEIANSNLERRVLERTADLKEANDEIQSFAYIVSHDLRSPLVNIMGFTSELDALKTDLFQRISELRSKADDAASETPQDATLRADFEEAIGFIKASITKMDRLIHAILALSREGRKTFVEEDVDMRGLVDQIAASMAHQLMERDARIHIGALPRLRSDRLALEQIFTNLIDNAVKYLREDVPGRIAVDAVETPGFVTFTVTDNGRGIDEKDRARVFELFRRSGRQDRPGEGIGLAHVRAMVRRMGGVISLESRLGEGATFKVTLPRRLPDTDRMHAS